MADAATARWSLDIHQWVKKQSHKISAVVFVVGQKAAAKIRERTPVDTGRAVAAWHEEYKEGGLTFELVNNVPYIFKLEYGGYPPGPKIVNGYSAKAPKGMVRITLAELPGVTKEVVARMK